MSSGFAGIKLGTSSLVYCRRLLVHDGLHHQNGRRVARSGYQPIDVGRGTRLKGAVSLIPANPLPESPPPAAPAPLQSLPSRLRPSAKAAVAPSGRAFS